MNSVVRVWPVAILAVTLTVGARCNSAQASAAEAAQLKRKHSPAPGFCCVQPKERALFLQTIRAFACCMCALDTRLCLYAYRLICLHSTA